MTERKHKQEHEQPEAVAEATPAEGAVQPQVTEAQPAPQDELTELRAKAAEYLDGWQRARAELDNYRKRMAREREEWSASLRAEIVLAMLPAIDDLDLAVANLPEDMLDHAWVNGVILAHRKLASQMQALGISELETVGKPFDPALHEAVTHEESEDHKSGEIVGTVRKGYKLGDKVIRPALVRVAS